MYLRPNMLAAIFALVSLAQMPPKARSSARNDTRKERELNLVAEETEAADTNRRVLKVETFIFLFSWMSIVCDVIVK